MTLGDANGYCPQHRQTFLLVYGKHPFVPRDQAFLIMVVCCSLFLHKNENFLISCFQKSYLDGIVCSLPKVKKCQFWIWRLQFAVFLQRDSHAPWQISSFTQPNSYVVIRKIYLGETEAKLQDRLPRTSSRCSKKLQRLASKMVAWLFNLIKEHYRQHTAIPPYIIVIPET